MRSVFKVLVATASGLYDASGLDPDLFLPLPLGEGRGEGLAQSHGLLVYLSFIDSLLQL